LTDVYWGVLVLEPADIVTRTTHAGLGYSSSANQDGLSSRSPAEAVLERGDTGGELVAVVGATSLITEPDIVRRRKTLGSGRSQACSSAVVNGAGSTAYVVDTIVAVCDNRVLRRARRERVDRVTNEVKLSIGVSEPVRHLLARDEVDGSRLNDVRESTI
jgi:hypothetical protein